MGLFGKFGTEPGRRITSVLLALVLVLIYGFAGCGGQDGENDAEGLHVRAVTPKQPVEDPVETPNFDRTDVGNSASNIIHGGWVAQSDGWVYLSYDDEELGYSLFKSRPDGSGRELLLDSECRFINVLDDTLYFVNEGEGGAIYSMDVNGSDLKRLNDADSEYAHVMGDWVYYINQDDDRRVYRLATDGSENTRITDYISRFVFAGEGYVFFQRMSAEHYQSGGGGYEAKGLDPDDVRFGNVDPNKYFERYGELFMLKPDGSEKQIVEYDNACFTAFIEDGVLYYGDYLGYLYRMPMPEDSQVTPAQLINEYCESVGDICISSEYYYYSDYHPDENSIPIGNIYRVAFATLERETIYTGTWAKNINIAGDVLYYHDGFREDAACRINTDGTQNGFLEGARRPVLVFEEPTPSDPVDKSLAALSITSKDNALCYKLCAVDRSGNEYGIRTVFLNPKSKCVIRFPEGTYILKTAEGTEWLGDDLAFGDRGIYSKTEPYEFEAGEVYYITTGERGDFYGTDKEGFVN